MQELTRRFATLDHLLELMPTDLSYEQWLTYIDGLLRWLDLPCSVLDIASNRYLDRRHVDRLKRECGRAAEHIAGITSSTYGLLEMSIYQLLPSRRTSSLVRWRRAARSTRQGVPQDGDDYVI